MVTEWGSSSKRILLASVPCLLALCGFTHAAQIDIPCPSTCRDFGTAVAVLPNGNIVATDPAGSISGVGAVYLFSSEGELISTLTGSSFNDHVGNDGIVVLTNGNFVVASSDWNGFAGAVTWVNGATGLSGVVSPSNSLVGATTNDQVGSGSITPLSNGNYVVATPNWNNGTATQAGAVTFANGTTGTTGVISASNSLVGTTTNDQIGSSGVTALSNGNYVVASPNWNNGATTKAGAATWANGTTGISGAISAVNSLVGTTTNDQVGYAVAALNNGNYVVESSQWNNGMVAQAGAATWASGTTGKSGAVSASNSLVGTTGGDHIGPVMPLSNGNFVVYSPFWNNGTVTQAGAATWANGITGITGAVSASNSLVGTTAYDQVGYDVTALANGNYVVTSRNWNNGTPGSNVGAATWGNGSTGIKGAVSVINSLVGTTASDQVGMGVTPLKNGNYIVESPNWNNGAATRAGAATFANGATGTTGIVSASNSLVGTTKFDQVTSEGVTALTNGNYVVDSPDWDNGTVPNVGAVTWGDGATGIAGAVSTSNSLVGSATGSIGAYGVAALRNGNYIVESPFWSNGTANQVGASTWANGAIGMTGTVSASNSLVGATTSDCVGMYAFVQSDGNYVIQSPFWTNGATSQAGAVTLASDRFRQAATIQGWNSVIGTAALWGLSMTIAYNSTLHQLVVGRPGDNIVSLFTMDQIFADGFEP